MAVRIDTRRSGDEPVDVPVETDGAHDAEAPELADLLATALRQIGTNRQLAVGDTLCEAGDDSHEAFVVLSGCIEARVVGRAGEMVVAQHREGATVGEVTALTGGHRTATLIACEPSVVAVVERDGLQATFDDHPDAATVVMTRARERTDRLRVAALLGAELDASDGQVGAAIADRVTWRSLGPGDVLYRRGDPADAAYLVVSGRLGVTDFGTESRGSDAQTIEIGRGGIVGEFGLLEDRERSATVTALRDTELARLSADDFGQLAREHSSLALGLVRRVLDRSMVDATNTATRRSFALAITAPVDDETRDDLVATITATLERCGETVRLTPQSVDDALRRHGISDIAPGGFGEIRLAELLHQAETDADHLILDTGAGLTGSTTPGWTRRALGYADQLVIIASPEPNPREERAIRALLDATPSRIPRWLALLHSPSCRRPSGTATIRQRFEVDEVLHLRGTSHREVARLARLAAGRGVGLVLSGGGARGHAHVGVYAVLDDLGVPVDRVIGASTGAIVAAAIGQQRSPDGLLSDLQRDTDALLDPAEPQTTPLTADRVSDLLEQQFADWDIEDLWIPFSCVSTNLTTAESTTHRRGLVATAARASFAIPGVLPPVAHDGNLHTDGGVLDNLPVVQFVNDPSVGVIIASDVAPPLGPSAQVDVGAAASSRSVTRRRPMTRPFRNAGRVVKRTVSNSAAYAASSKLVRTVRRTPRHEEAEFVAHVARSGDARGEASTVPSAATTVMRSLLIGSSRRRDDQIANGAIDLYIELDVREIALLDFSQVGPAADAGLVQSRGPVTEWLATRGGSPWGDADDDGI